MTEHALWNDVEMSYEQLSDLAKGWRLSSRDARLSERPFRPRVMRYADVRAVGDPALAAFEMVFHHQMNRLPRSVPPLLPPNCLVNILSVAARVGSFVKLCSKPLMTTRRRFSSTTFPTRIAQ